MRERPRTAGLPPMSAVPRWSHRDPVEGGNPFPVGELCHMRWEEATARARAALQRYDADLSASEVATSEPDVYAHQWMDLAMVRFDTWARRGLAAVDGTAAQRDYARWLRTYVANWRVYVEETCPHVAASIRRELGSRLAARAAHWINGATRTGRIRRNAHEPINLR